jgi:hypothetical protein
MATGCTIKSADPGTPVVPTPDSGGGADAYGGGDGYSSDGGACLTDDGVAPTCAGANTSCTAACERFIPNYKKGVARAITDCIIALPTCEGAETEITACVQSALSKTCDDPSAGTFCSPVVESCLADGGTNSSLDLAQCTDLARGLNETGREAFTTCITDESTGYCKADPSTCFSTLK